MNEKYPSFKKIVATLLDLENKYNLLEWKINDIFVWQSARMLIFTKLLDSCIPSNAIINKKSLLQNIKSFFKRCIINSLLHNPFFDFNKSDVLVFESGRKYLVDDHYIDIYTKYFCDDLKKENISYQKYEINYNVSDLTPRYQRTKHLDFILIISKLTSKFVNPKLSETDKELTAKLETSVYEQLGIRINLLIIFTNEIKRFKSQYPFYKILFQLKRAKKIYIINSSDKAPLIKAAKDNDIIVTELQHGLIIKESLSCHFPNTRENSLEYFPNKFYIWEDLNMCTSKIPISIECIVNFRNKHLDYMLEKNRNITCKENQVLIVSQPYSSPAILQFIIDNIEELPNWQFVYKLHPLENPDLFINSFLFSKYKNLTIVKNDSSIYKLVSESKFVIGVYSTAVFEATYFGCNTLLLNLPGIEMSYSLVESNKAKLIDINERLQKYL